MYTSRELDGTFDAGYRCGQEDARDTDNVDQALDVAMQAGEIRGRRQGERDTYLELHQLLRDHDYDELAARISSRALGEFADTFLLVESGRQKSPEEFRQLVEAVEEGEEAVSALAARWGVNDDLMDVADAAGATPLDADALRGAEVIGDEIEAWLAQREDEA